MPDTYIYPPGEPYLFGRREMQLNPVHIVKAAPNNYAAICGVTLFSADTGAVLDGSKICPRCLRVLKIKSADLPRGQWPW